MNIIAVIKHISIKNSNYDAAYDYLTTKHDEFTSKLIWDENRKRIPRESFLIEGILWLQISKKISFIDSL
ncbi:MAG: hypothetical protein ACLS8T_14685 [Anaerobutyricum sp.]|jgi:relaxase/mobilisation nuclease domain